MDSEILLLSILEQLEAIRTLLSNRATPLMVTVPDASKPQPATDMLKLPVIDQGKRLNEEELLAPTENPRREFFMAFANAVGIEPRNVTGLVVRLDPGLPFAQVEVTSIAPKGAGQAAAEVLQKFNLVARSEGDPQVVGSSDKSVSLMTSEETTHRVVGSPADPQPEIGAPLPANGSTPLET